MRPLARGTLFRDCAGCPDMVVIPAGSVTPAAVNGDPALSSLEQPSEPISIAGAIGIGKYEVSRGQFAQFVQASGYVASASCFAWNGSRYEKDPSKDWRNPGFEQSDRDPVICVNWRDAKAYTDWLSQKTGKHYRLPTEAEWEYAARAGNRAPRPWGDRANEACRYANVADASAKRDVPGIGVWTFHQCDDHHAYTAPAGSYRPNAFGLYDMLGNAWEWTEDCWSEEPAPGTALVPAPTAGADPAPAAAGDRALANGACNRGVLRGGGWVDSPAFVTYGFRFFIGPDDRDFYAGFRVVRSD